MASSAPGDSVPAIPVVPPPAHMLSQPELDLSKLQSLPADHQDIFVLTFVSNFSRHVLSLNAEDCTAQQFYVKKETFKVLNLTSPQPTRIIRNNLGQCLAHVFEHGDRKLLFETINELAAIVGGPKPKTEAESRNRHAAVSLLGHVYGAAGDSAIGLHQMAVGVLIRLLKSSSSHAGLRAAVFVALTKMVSMIQGSMDESVARDIWKQSRSHAAADKGALVIIAACDCMRALVQGTPFFRNSADFDKLETAVFKAIDSPSAPVRHASADCITEALVLAHSENVGESAAARAKKPKPKSLRRTATVTMATAGSGAEDDEIPSRSSSPAPGANGRRQDSLVLVVPEMVKILSNQYVKPATSNKGRAGIGVCYSMLFKKLGEKLVQANFVFLVEHFAADILVNSHIANNRYRLLMARKIVEILLQDIAGQRILGESGQIFVANALIAHVLKNSLQPATEKVDSTKETLIVALGAIRALVKALGSAANGFAEACRDALLQVLQHPSYSVQVHAGQSELRVSATQIQVAWILIGGLMALGPNFVKIHLSQLLLMWKNALPKPLAKDNTASRSLLEASFLAHVRECALGSILAFLHSIATAAGAFETIWDVGDNSGFGVTGLVHNMAPDPTATEVVNTAIQLFAFIFPQTPAKVQESILEQIKTFASAGSLQRDPGRKAAINVNVATALLCTMRVVARETKSPTGNVTNMAVERLLQDMVRDFVLDEDPYVRSLGYAAVARLCNACGNAFTNTEIKFLVDTIVMNREPSARAGCAMAFGAIQSKVGGMAAGFHLKTIHSILITLANDPHPTVHFWALEALALASNAAGLGFSQYVSSTLGMVAQMYTSDTHNAEMASVITMNLEVDMSTTTAITRCVDSMINVLGPDLQDSTKSRELTLTLVSQFQGEKNTLVQQASLDCMEHLSLYAPGHIIFADYVQLLQKYMNSDHVTLRDAAVDGLYNVMKRNPQQVVSTARAGFERELWVVLDSDPAHDGIRNIIRSWMRQTALESTAAWVQRFQSVLKMTRQRDHGRNSQASKSQGPAIDLRDEEVAGFAGAAKDAENDGDGDDGIASSEAEPLRWQVTTFAMECLSELFLLVAKDAVATGGNSASQRELQARIGDVVQMAFSASTSGVLELRIWGLKIIGAVLRMFGKTPDPDFDEAMLLEQYQAQISSALTPAFAADSSPELAAEAVNVCANFISTGIVTDVERMGRILKTLVTALENLSKGTENAGIGDLKALSSNAQVMVKMAVFAAWAELQVASADQQYLVDVLRPHIATLTPLWLESLREFARLRFEPDISMTLGPPSLSGSLDTIYAALNRETLLKFYQDSWLKLVDAIASLIEQDSDFVFDALDDKKTDNSNAGGSGSVSGPNRHRSADINYRDEPLAFFFVLFGIAFEALATKPSQSDSLASEAQTLSILKALKKILHPSVSGHAIYRDAIFSETMDLLDRLALTDGLDVQGVIVEIARDLCIAHPSARKRNDSKNLDAETDEADTDLSEDIEQLFELTRIIVLVLSGLLPNLNDNSAQPVRHQMNEEAMLLVRTALEALADAADVFPAIIQTDLHACIIHIFATMLATPMCQDLVVPQTLPIFKRFIAGVTGLRGGVVANTSTASSAVSEGAVLQLRGCLRRFLSVYLIAQRREQPNALMCVKNALLASTILFTGGSNQLPASDPLVARYLDEVVDCLTDRMTAKTAANCIRSLLLQPSPTAADHSIARYLVPRLIAFATNTAPEDPEAARPLVMLALTKYSSTLPRERLPVAFAVMITALLAWASAEEEDPGSSSGNSSGSSRSAYAHASARLLELAAVSADAFKAVVAGLNASQRAFLEAIVRHGQKPGAADQGHETQRGEQPTIELKMNFGA
ncbi:Pof6 interactor protein 1 [Ceratocystis platani]|uniref:Pof6 interactor protein 1 n=1 Tax=Ceratocystis fimbriata f. sp. platani TaxID=88771 RepID=A0A0F8DJ68_CERFI|nr:Pof6 interactor protein 1 [Ceratocystis platani]